MCEVRLGDLKISTGGMPVNRPIATRLFVTTFESIRIVGKDGNFLVLEIDKNQVTTINDLQQYHDDLEIVIRDSDQTLHKIYGYRIIEDVIMLG